MLAKAPDDRPDTPGVVADALRPFSAGADPVRLLTRADRIIPTPGRPGATTVSRIRKVWRGVGRHTLAAAAGAAVLIALPFPGLRRGQTEPSAGGVPSRSRPLPIKGMSRMVFA